jgi:hypothetical protein
MSQEGSGLGNALFAVARFRVGRILMWIIATPFLFMGSAGFLPGGGDGGRFLGGIFGIGAILALFAIVGAWKERRERSPSPIRWFLIRLAFAGIVLGGAMLLTWLTNRRSKAALALPTAPPQPEEVDRLCGAKELVG